MKSSKTDPNEHVEDFFSTNRFILTFAGLWPSLKYNFGMFGTLHHLHKRVVLCGLAYYTLAEFICMKDTYGDVLSFSKSVTITLTHTVGAIKEIFLWYHREKFESIISLLKDNGFGYDACDDFDPWSTWRKYQKDGRFWTLLFLFLTFATASSGMIPKMVAALMDFDEYIPPETMPYFIWVPFKLSTNFRYFCALLYQAMPVFYHAIAVVGVDSLYVNIMNAIACNLVCIQGAFTTIRGRCVTRIAGEPLTPDGLYNSKELNFHMKSELNRVCRHLQVVYKAVADLETLFKYILLLQTTTMILILCSSLYLVFTTPFGERIITEIVYILAISCQLLLYCSFGNEIPLKHAEIPTAIWKSDWLAADTDFKRVLMFTMTRANVNMYLTAGNFAGLTLGMFLQVIKGSYSFYAFMKNAQKE